MKTLRNGALLFYCLAVAIFSFVVGVNKTFPVKNYWVWFGVLLGLIVISFLWLLFVVGEIAKAECKLEKTGEQE